MVKKLSKHYRCIIPNFPGFGFSEFNEAYGITITGQSEILEQFIDLLELSDIIFLGHDTGGPSGFTIASRRPHLFRALILTDTIIYPTREYQKLHYFLPLLNTWLFRWINRNFNFIVWGMLNKLKSGKVKRHIQEHYFRAFNTKSKRNKIVDLLYSLRESGTLMARVKKAFETTLIDKPCLLIYGEKDPVNNLGIPERILKSLHNAELHIIKKEGHFPHEGNGKEMARIIEEWINRKWDQTSGRTN